MEDKTAVSDPAVPDLLRVDVPLDRRDEVIRRLSAAFAEALAKLEREEREAAEQKRRRTRPHVSARA